jgi:hypothetical protein
MPIDPESNLHWKAFLYVSGELADDEALDFEQLLLDDQSAREAVASAVELVQTVGIVGADSGLILPIKRRGRRKLAWAGALAAAAAVVAAALIPSLRSIGKAEPNASEVALAWSGLRQGIEADWKAVVAGSAPVEPTDSGVTADDDPSVEPANERPLPSWLLSAASAPRGESPTEDN